MLHCHENNIQGLMTSETFTSKQITSICGIAGENRPSSAKSQKGVLYTMFVIPNSYLTNYNLCQIINKCLMQTVRCIEERHAPGVTLLICVCLSLSFI